MEKSKQCFLAISLLLVAIIQSCGQKVSNIDNEQDSVKNRYTFKPIPNTQITEELKDELYVPFLENGKYHFTDFEGERISNKEWDEIIFLGYPFFWGKNDGLYQIFRFPDELAVNRKFEIKMRHNMPYIGVEEETETEITYRISIDTTIIVARETNDVNETSEIVAEGYDEVRTKKDYFFKYKEYERVKSEVREKSPFIIVSEGGKFGINDTLNNIFIEPSFTERPRILNSIKWICVRKNGQYGIIDFSGNWVFPLEARKVALAFNPGNQKYMFELKEKGYRFLFNNNLELVLEQPVLYFQNEYFDWAAVSDSIRPIMSEIIRPKLYQQYYVLSDDEYGHVFTADGKYISSHKGTYDYNVSFEGLPRQNKYHSEFVPVGKFVEKGKEYYVRLSDGFEYKRN